MQKIAPITTVSFTGPPSFSSNLQPNLSQMTGLGSPNDIGLVSSTSAGPVQQPIKPILSPNAPSATSGNPEFQASYNGTELVMLYDYKVSQVID